MDHQRLLATGLSFAIYLAFMVLTRLTLWRLRAPLEQRQRVWNVLRYGFTDRVISMHSKPKPRTQPARLEVALGTERQTIEVLPKKGWFESRFSLSADQAVDVIKLKATSANPVDAHLCVSATIRKQGG